MAKNKEEKKLDDKLLAVYKQHGRKAFLDVCSKMLSIVDKENIEKRMKVNGEVCEVVLRVLTLEYLKLRSIEGKVFNSVILKDLQGRADFRTELDFVLLAPSVCLTGECKSFSGDIIVTDEGTLHRGDLVADVYKQSSLHAKCLYQYLMPGLKREVVGKKPPFGIFCFVYSNGSIVDKRAAKDKGIMPVLTMANLYKYYDKIFNQCTASVYDYRKLSKDFLEYSTSERLHREHQAYLGY